MQKYGIPLWMDATFVRNNITFVLFYRVFPCACIFCMILLFVRIFLQGYFFLG